MKYLITFISLFLPAIAFAAPIAGWDTGANNRAQAQQDLEGLMDKEFLINIILWIVTLVATVIVAKFARAKLVTLFEETLGTDESSDVAWVVIRMVNIVIWVIWFSLMLTFWWLDLSLLLWWVWIWLWFTMQIFLSNFIAWIIIIFGWEYKTGHIIQIDNREGTIKKIATLFTVVEQYDGVIFYVPNVKFLQDVVKCYTANTKRRVEVEVWLDYAEDITKAKELINKVIESFPYILIAPAPFTIVNDLWENGVWMKIYFWISIDSNYFEIKSNVTETINLAFKQAWVKRKMWILEIRK